MFPTLTISPPPLPPCSSTSIPSHRNQAPFNFHKGSFHVQSISPSVHRHPSQPQSFHASWAESIRSLAISYQFHAAISTYIAMTTAGVSPDNFSLPAVIKCISSIGDFNLGTQVHAAALKLGYHESCITVANTFLSMYAKCGRLDDAVQVFDKMVKRDQVTWNSFIAALCHFEEWETALEAFRAMQVDQWGANSFTLVSASLACSQLNKQEGLRLGKELHGYGLKDRICFNRSFSVNALISMYVKLGRVQDGFNLFKLFEMRDLVTWNTMISSFVQNELLWDALNLFREMVMEGLKPDGMTLSSILPACAHLEMLQIGKEIHGCALRNDCLFENSFVAGALVDMYCNCRDTQSGKRVFDGISEARIGLWNAMISGYARNELDENALRLFVEMESEAGLVPNPTTIASVMPACVRSDLFFHKEGIHGYIIKRGFADDRYVQNAILDMYSRVDGNLEISQKIFENMNDKDIVSWNTMITGYANNNCLDDALRLVGEMWKGWVSKETGRIKCPWKPNTITLMTVLPGCGALSALSKGRELHAYAIRQDLSKEITVASALVDMYAKCGCLNQARTLFNNMHKRNIITWNVLIMAYGMHGHGTEAIRLFKDMEANDGVKANDITFIALFAACSHSGLVEEGLEIYYKMKEEHNVDPTPDHYACVVDFLGRAGKLNEALGIIQSMPSGLQKTGAWSCLLGACRLHGDVGLGETAASNLFSLEPNVASHYVLMSNIYSSAGLWDKAMEVRRKMKEMGVRKEPGCSWIQIRDEVHRFTAGDESHPQNRQLNELLEELQGKMKREGYVADTSCVLHNIGKEEKEYMLCGHSERLAIAFGILNSTQGSAIRVAKNLRICKDCHVATKYISKIVGREIIVRDVRRFHHFKDGECSCGDYW